MSEVIVQLRVAPPGAVAGAPASPAGAVGADLLRTGLRLEPLHPGATDPASATWYRVDVPADRDVQAVAAALRERADVRAAYVKPPAATP
ncbi:hypothetical protein [Kitasatospora sp. NPDC088346]|uniref:hypothetical protein n=1 Tax=Kitasatospora sp. NPDC088346 TaxID=3364073 RepID=UPI003803B32A